MFERYTEKARRVIFFARYEASHFGSQVIATEHLLLGLLREDKRISLMLGEGAANSIRAHIDAQLPRHASIPTSVDLPLSKGAKRVLNYAADEADLLNHRHIGCEHLLRQILGAPEFYFRIVFGFDVARPGKVRLGTNLSSPDAT